MSTTTTTMEFQINVLEDGFSIKVLKLPKQMKTGIIGNAGFVLGFLDTSEHELGTNRLVLSTTSTKTITFDGIDPSYRDVFITKFMKSLTDWRKDRWFCGCLAPLKKGWNWKLKEGLHKVEVE